MDFDQQKYDKALEDERLDLAFAQVKAAGHAGAVVGSMFSGSTVHFDWHPDDHPRDLLGKFKAALSDLSRTGFYGKPDRLAISKTISVSKNIRGFTVHADGVTHKVGSAEEAAKKAFGTHADKFKNIAPIGRLKHTQARGQHAAKIAALSQEIDEDLYEEELLLARGIMGRRHSKNRLGAGSTWAGRFAGTRPGSSANTGTKSTNSSGTFQNSQHPRASAGVRTGGQFIKSGSSGQEVAAVQQAVGIKATGNYGKRTVQAVEQYQRQNGLLVDGIVGAETAGSILGANNPPAPGALQPGQITALTSSGALKRSVAQTRSTSLTRRNRRRALRRAGG